MIYRTLTAFILSITTSFGALTIGGNAPEASTTSVVTFNTEPSVSKASLPDMYEVMLHAQIHTHKAGSIRFWEAVSWCETNHKWNDGGYYSGGLGMAQSVWVSYGGKQFASRPSRATKTQQMIVANRAAFLGYQTLHTYASLADKQNNKPYFRPAVGWRNMKKWGRDCVNWRTRKPLRDKYTQTPLK